MFLTKQSNHLCLFIALLLLLLMLQSYVEDVIFSVSGLLGRQYSYTYAVLSKQSLFE